MNILPHVIAFYINMVYVNHAGDRTPSIISLLISRMRSCTCVRDLISLISNMNYNAMETIVLY